MTQIDTMNLPAGGSTEYIESLLNTLMRYKEELGGQDGSGGLFALGGRGNGQQPQQEQYAWKCGSCWKVIAGGAYMLNTPPAVTAKTTIGRMRKMLEAQS